MADQLIVPPIRTALATNADGSPVSSVLTEKQWWFYWRDTASQVNSLTQTLGGGGGGDSVTFNDVPVTHLSDRAQQSTFNFKGDYVSVKMFGAVGDGVTDDTVAIQKALDWAKTQVGTTDVAAVTLFFPRAEPYYKVTATVQLFSYLELIGYRAKILYSGTGALFSIPQSFFGSIHGFILEGNETADQWAIKIAGTGTPANGANTLQIYDNLFYKWGDLATNSGGAIWNAADSGKMVVGPHNLIMINGTGFLTTGPTDALNIHDNYFQGHGRAMDFSGESGAAQITISYNNIVNACGAFRQQGAGTYIIVGNEYEPEFPGPINNVNSAIWEFLGDASGLPAIVKFLYNFTSMHDQCTYGVYDSGNTVFSDFDFNSFAGAAPVDPLQFGMYNSNPTQTNRYGCNNRMYQLTANLYKFPNDPGIRIWPLTTTKGDLVVHGTVTSRLPVGTNGQVLVADSAQALGVKWGAGTYMPGLPSTPPAAGSKQLWYDPADGNRVKFVP